MTKLSALLLPLLLVACDSNPNVPPPKPAPTGASNGAATGAATDVAGAKPGGVKESAIVWKAPDAWPVVEHPSPMRLATYRIPKADGDAEDGELTVTRVGGDVQSNVGRWVKQFAESPEPKTSERTAGELKVTIVELEGTYQGMAAPGQQAAGPKQGYAMLAAIVEGPGDPHFFKMTGPKKTVDAARGGFDELVGSFGKR
jgi:hypothetical protein